MSRRMYTLKKQIFVADLNFDTLKTIESNEK